MNEDDIMLADNIKLLREKKGLTQEGLAEKSGLSLSTIKRYENGGTKNPGAESVKLLAETLGCTSVQLMEHDFSKGNPTEAQDEDLDFLHFFEGQSYVLYYLTEKKNGIVKNGELHIEKDREGKCLHGRMKLHHWYDCRIEIVDNCVFIYGTGEKVSQHAVIVIHRPDFGEDKEFKYRGGVGLVLHINTHRILAAQRICLISGEMKKSQDSEIISALYDEDVERITVDIKSDSDFSQWIVN